MSLKASFLNSQTNLIINKIMFGIDKTKMGFFIGSLLVLTIIVVVIVVMNKKESFDTI